jgi:hypothetical protein
MSTENNGKAGKFALGAAIAAAAGYVTGILTAPKVARKRVKIFMMQP